MIYKSTKRIVLIAVLFFISFQSKAWGVLGHRIIGEIAESYLTKTARRNISEILGNESIAMTANWADFIKSDSNYKYLYNWHFINLSDGLSETDVANYLASDTAIDAYTKVNFCIEQLKHRAALLPADRLLYLRVLIHVIGDIHEPMHEAHKEDSGGNKVKVLWFNSPTNLHSVWDDKLVDFQQLSYTEYVKAINFTTKAQREVMQAEPVSKWIINSYMITRRIYADITEPDQKLDYKYNFNYLSTLNQQLLTGGVHLAGVLNDIFG